MLHQPYIYEKIWFSSNTIGAFFLATLTIGALFAVAIEDFRNKTVCTLQLKIIVISALILIGVNKTYTKEILYISLEILSIYLLFSFLKFVFRKRGRKLIITEKPEDLIMWKENGIYMIQVGDTDEEATSINAISGNRAPLKFY